MITVATYNILHGFYKDKILGNLRTLIIKEKAEVILIQEADKEFERYLRKFAKENKGWKIKITHTGLGGDLAILWNSDAVKLINIRVLKLPYLDSLPLVARLLKFQNIFQRGAIVGTFIKNKNKFVIANTHFSSVDGNNSLRLKQLNYVKKDLDNMSNLGKVIAGDFNTLVLPHSGKKIEAKIENELSGWSNATKEIKWTCDLSHIDSREPDAIIKKMLRFFGVKFECKLDHIFVKGFRIKKVKMLDLPGSDHRPLVAKLELKIEKE